MMKRLSRMEANMQLEIPDGVQVHLTIGAPHAAAPLLALADGTAARDRTPSTMARFAKGMVLAGLLVGCFQAGRLTSPRTGPVQAVQAANASTAAQPPASPLAPAPFAQPASNEVPPAFRDQLARAPQVTPTAPPAPSPSSGQAPPNPFGLHE